MSTQISQKVAVVNEVKAILGSSFDPSLPAKDQLTKAQIDTIKANIVSGILNGTISYGLPTENTNDVSSYVSGLISNHFRKSKELNGGSTYVPQSTGKGSRDDQISELNKLLKTFKEGSEEYNQVLSAIAERKEELASLKQVQVKANKKHKELSSINTDILPESLRGLASSLINNG